MKTEPNELDREAATMFRPAPGMRVLAYVNFRRRSRWGRVLTGIGGDAIAAEEVASVKPAACQTITAIDTDDDATKGVMLAQVRDATPHIGHRPPTTDSDINGVGRRMWCVHNVDGARFLWCETEGAALVAAMRALKGTATP